MAIIANHELALKKCSMNKYVQKNGNKKRPRNYLQRCLFHHSQDKVKEQVSILLLVTHTLELKNHSSVTYCVEIANNQSLHQL